MAKSNEQLVDVELVYIRDTAKSFMCERPRPKKPLRQGFKEEVIFLPMSLVERDGHIFTMPEWLAIEKGIDNLVKE